jgi:leukotriene A-4 hydrolase/aminopeptidase
MQSDPHSFSAPSKARVTHLHWNATVDFTRKVIEATATWDIQVSPGEQEIVFDTKGLSIKKVSLDDGTQTEFSLDSADVLLGQALRIRLDNKTKSISIEYETQPGTEAVQWLEPQQTAGKEKPFLFTQSQAILARSWIPCQDSPGIRFTYEADVTVPKDLLALMSASNPQKKNESGSYHFEMKQPIPSYLLALAAGEIEFEAISDRSGIYAEPSVLDTAIWEFADLEKMIQGAEDLYGPYLWERYDVIVLPPSFPFGGMENPRLTFATPSILAGDRSLTSLIAHELAHSWSGNLVTNGTWNDFWLNEGFTVYFEHRIMEKLYGRDYEEMLSLLALQDLKETVQSLKAENLYADTKLKLALEGRNPDDGVTDIAYQKGYFFLRLFEEKYGREKFDAFLKNYFASNAFKSLNTDMFIADIKKFYNDTYNITLDDNLFKKWIFMEGLPENCPVPQSDRFENVDAYLARWRKGERLDRADTKDWSTHEWLHFLKNLPDSLTTANMNELDAFGKFTASGNSEIITQWLVTAIRHQYSPAYAKLEEFLINTGRRKFLVPLYNELIKTPGGKQRAAEIYRKARPNYHFVATSTFDKIVK